MRLILKATTPWEKEVRTRIRRGVKLLDSVTPGWFTPINVATLAVSNRQMCVFAQASHNFKQGIVQVAEKAVEEGKKVELLNNYNPATLGKKYHWLPATGAGKPSYIDVFFYGFDVTWEDATKFLGITDRWDSRGSRKNAFKTIDRMWREVVEQKQKHAATAAAMGQLSQSPEQVRMAKLAQAKTVVKPPKAKGVKKSLRPATKLQPNASFKTVAEWGPFF